MPYDGYISHDGKPMITEHLEKNSWTHKTTPEGWTHCFDESGKQRCGTKRSNGKPCKTYLGLYDTGRCNKHQMGAANKRGFDHPSTKDGAYSMMLKNMPSKMAATLDSVKSDPELYSLDRDIALTDTMIIELLPRLYSGDYGELWLEMKNLYDEAGSNWRASLRSKNPEALLNFQTAFKELGEYIKKGQRDWITRKEVVQLSNHKRALVKTVSDVEYKGENAVTMADFMAVMAHMELTFTRAIASLDKEQQRRVSQAYAEGVLRIVPKQDVG